MKILISVVLVIFLLILFLLFKNWKVVLILKDGKVKLKIGFITAINPDKKNKKKQKEEKYIKIPKVTLEKVKEKFDGVRNLYKDEKEEISDILKTVAKKADIRQINTAVTYGFGNAAITGMTNGFIWTSVTAVVTVVKRYIDIEKKLNLAVYPEFTKDCFDVYLFVDMRVRIASFLKIAYRAKKLYDKAKKVYKIV